MMNEKYCLLVEDDPEDQELFIDALHEISASTGCYAVSNGQEAMRVLLEENINPDYIFTDLNMPLMDGFEFVRALRKIEQFKATPVIVFSSDFSDEQIARFKPFNILAFYSKTRMDVLKQILKKYFPDVKRPETIL